MRLSRIWIKNFRSIKELTLEFEPRCRILVGINESGKSNILTALSFLSPDIQPSKTDLRYERDDELITDGEVRFIFRLDADEQSRIAAETGKQCFNPDPNAPIVARADQRLSLDDACRSHREALYRVDMLRETKSSSYWARPDWAILASWKKPTPACPPDFSVSLPDGTLIALQKYKLINTEHLQDAPVPEGYLTDAAVADLNEIIHLEIQKLMNEGQLPTCLSWTYSESNLLPGQINMTQFAASPAVCRPLKNMFELAGVSNITAELTDKKAQPIHVLRNLLNRVASITTQHIRTVWPEYANLRIDLSPNGDNIDATVSEQRAVAGVSSTAFDFSRRSDGFKRFVTFLLMVSTQVQTNALKNTLLLIDEPESGLHPSGAKHLMNELIRIAKDNYVVFSTHSISMIDKEEIGRHYIVEKKDEITTLRTVETSNIVDEEVIFRAIGYSIFDTLKVRNIVFEGWRDKHLCELVLKGPLANDLALQGAFNDIGRCHAQGVKDVRNITAVLEMAGRRCLVVSDDDSAAKERQKDYVENRGYGLWRRYSELVPDAPVKTAEDYIRQSAFRPLLDKLRTDHSALPPLTDADLGGHGGKLQIIDSWLAKGGIETTQRKKLVRSMKEKLFADLRADDIEEGYADVVRAMVKPEYWPSE
jgi:hypothetical protein